MFHSRAATLPRPRSLLHRHDDFRRLWTGDTVSQLGTQVSALAVPLIALNQLGAGPAVVALLVALQFLPFAVLGLPAGVWCDNHARRPVLVGADLLRLLLLLSVPLAFWVGRLTIAHLLAVVLLMGVCTTFFDVAYQAYLPSLVDVEDLVEGNATLQASASVAQLVGPAVAGGLIHVLTAPLVLLLDAASFLVSAARLRAIRGPEATRVRAAESSLHQVRVGLRHVRRTPLLRWLAATTALLNGLMAAMAATITVFLVRDLHLDAGAIGLLMTLGSTGAVLGAVATTGVVRRWGYATAITVPMSVGALLGLLIPLARPGGALVLFVLGWFGFSLAFAAYNVAGVSLRQATCPPGLQARVNATVRFVALLPMPLTAALIGPLTARVGARSSLWLIVCCVLVVPLLLARAPIPHRLPVPPSEQVPGA